MEINSRAVGLITVVDISGVIDAKSVLSAQEQLLALVRPGSKLLLNLHRVTYMSSSGLRMLLSVYRQISSNNGSIVLAETSEEIKEDMAVTGFLRYFSIYDSFDEGLTALQ